MTPLRIQRSRTKGWRLPTNTVCVSRPGKWGNPWKPAPAIREESVSAPATTAADCARFYDRMLADRTAPSHVARASTIEALRTLRGRNLACWCRLCPKHAQGKPFDVRCTACAPCHADPLGRYANGPLTCEETHGQ